MVVSGGGSSQSGCGLGSSCGTSFDNLLHLLATAPHNNDLLAQLVTFDTQFNPVVSASDKKSLPTVVSGGQEFEVNVQ